MMQRCFSLCCSGKCPNKNARAVSPHTATLFHKHIRQDMNPGKRYCRHDQITIHDQVNNITMKMTFIFFLPMLTRL